MDIEELLKKYKKKAEKLARIKSALCGTLIGFIVNFAVALILWFTDCGILTVLMLSIGLGIVSGVAAAFMFYFMRFKPSTESVAKMVDRLGLEERVITMYEKSNDRSAIADLQREDAVKKVSTVSPERIKFKISKVIIVLIAFVGVLGISMTTVSALSAADNTASGGISGPVDPNTDPTEKPEEEEIYVELYYLAGDGGIVTGETYQRILKGKDATPVVAEAKEGYTFLQWSDGHMLKERWDWSVMEDKTVTAIFTKNSSGSGSSGEGGEEGEGGDKQPGEGGEEGEGSDKQPGEGGEDGEEGDDGEGNEGQEGQEGQEGGDGQGGEDGEGNDGEGNSQGSGGSKPSEDQGGQGDGGGKGETSDGQGGNGAGSGGKRDDNSVVDGKTNYKDAVDYEKEKERVENNDELPPELKDALSGYFDGMKP